MTISLLRRIWHKIITDIPVAPARQRLTGFEPLEPRMVLSGFAAYLAPDYLSPPPGDFSHLERSGAEIARPHVAFGEYLNYNAFGRGVSDSAPEFRTIAFEPVAGLFDHPALEERYSEEQSPAESITIVKVPVTPELIDNLSISPLMADRFFGIASSISFSASFTPMTTMATMSSSGFRSLTDRDYNPISSGGAVEQHADEHAYAGGPHVSSSDASLALSARVVPASDRYGGNAAMNAALASQAGGTVSSVAGQMAEGSTAPGQANAQSNGYSDPQQDGLLELTEGERLKLKRKLSGNETETEEATSSKADRSEQFEGSDSQVAYDPTRPFNAVAIADSSLAPIADANLADDGLIEILATDVTATLASRDVIQQAAANRQLVMEPAVATYQAFEVVVDGDARVATEVVADAARLAGAVAMHGQPVVQAE